MGIKHRFVSTIEDEPAQTDRVRPSNWNDDHTIDDDVDFNGFATVNATKPYRIESADYPVVASDYYIEADTSGITITLLNAADNTGRKFNIDNSSNGAIFITPINGEEFALYPDEAITVVSNGTSWRVK